MQYTNFSARLTAALCASMMAVGAISASATDDMAGDVASLDMANSMLETEIQGDVMLIDEATPDLSSDFLVSSAPAMLYASVTAVDEGMMTLAIAGEPDALEVILTDTTAFVDAATGLALDPASVVVGSEIYAYLPFGSNEVTAIVGNLAADMGAPVMVTAAEITPVEGGVRVLTTEGESFTVVMGETILNRYVAWGMPATMDLPIPDEIVVGRNLLITADAMDAEASLYRCTMLPVVVADDAETLDVVDEITYAPETILVNDAPLDVTALEVDGAMLFPLRAVAQAFDITVGWQEASYSAYVVLGEDTVVPLPFGEDVVLVSDTTYVSAEALAKVSLVAFDQLGGTGIAQNVLE